MHSKSNARRVLAAVSAVAALAALPTAAGAAHHDDGKRAVEQIQSELEQMRTVIAADTTDGAQREAAPLEEEVAVESGTPTRAELAGELTSLRRAIDARPRTDLLARMRMSQLRVAADGDASLRMACTDHAVTACRGIAWLTAEDGSLLGAGVFRVPAGEAKRVVLDTPEGGRRGGRSVLVRAAVRDASGTVWTNARHLTMES